MPHILKPGEETFIPVEGPYANRRFEKGVVYDDVPENELARFDQVVTDEPKRGRKKQAEAEQQSQEPVVEESSAPPETPAVEAPPAVTEEVRQ